MNNDPTDPPSIAALLPSVTTRILRNPHILPTIPPSLNSWILSSRHHERVSTDVQNGKYLKKSRTILFFFLIFFLFAPAKLLRKARRESLLQQRVRDFAHSNNSHSSSDTPFDDDADYEGDNDDDDDPKPTMAKASLLSSTSSALPTLKPSSSFPESLPVSSLQGRNGAHHRRHHSVSGLSTLLPTESNTSGSNTLMSLITPLPPLRDTLGLAPHAVVTSSETSPKPDGQEGLLHLLLQNPDKAYQYFATHKRIARRTSYSLGSGSSSVFLPNSGSMNSMSPIDASPSALRSNSHSTGDYSHAGVNSNTAGTAVLSSTLFPHPDPVTPILGSQPTFNTPFDNDVAFSTSQQYPTFIPVNNYSNSYNSFFDTLDGQQQQQQQQQRSYDIPTIEEHITLDTSTSPSASRSSSPSRRPAHYYYPSPTSPKVMATLPEARLKHRVHSAKLPATVFQNQDFSFDKNGQPWTCHPSWHRIMRLQYKNSGLEETWKSERQRFMQAMRRDRLMQKCANKRRMSNPF